MLKFSVTLLYLVSVASAQERIAIVRVTGDVVGSITFTQEEEDGPVVIEGTVEGLDAGYRGFHIHEIGDLTNGCTSAAGHYNPYNSTHGSPDNPIRHVGDLGNILFNENQIAEVYIVDEVISLSGKDSIIGRTLVIHSEEDDLGLTDHPDSTLTGNAGGRAGCGIVGIVTQPRSNSASLTVLSFYTSFFVMLKYFVM